MMNELPKEYAGCGLSKRRIISWLLQGDISIRYQVHRDLLGNDLRRLQRRIESEGWGARLLNLQRIDGHWGRGFYQPKWTSTHYTLLDLKNLCVSPNNKRIKKAIEMTLKDEKGIDGGINPAKTINDSDVCVNGMFLNYASYFKTDEKDLRSIVDFLISQMMDDGGFNCQSNMDGAKHSSLHSTISVAEGIREYFLNRYDYRLEEMLDAERSSQGFMLSHRLFMSDKTGEVIDKKFLRLSYPSRWRYDILRALDYFRNAGCAYDDRMEPAIEELLKKRKKQGYWFLQAHHPGQTHFDMEKPGEPSRWNTLRAIRVLEHFA